MIDTIPRQYKDWEHPILGDYDGSLLFEERLADIVTDTTGFEPAKEILREFYEFVQVRPIHTTRFWSRMVTLWGQLSMRKRSTNGPDKHREISQALAGFASDANDIVKNHVGAPVYTGGDDVLAFMPLHTVLACAKASQRSFMTLQSFPYEGNTPPLSQLGSPSLIILTRCAMP